MACVLWAFLAMSLALSLPRVASAPRYSSRIVDTQSGAIRGIIMEPNSRHLEPVEAFLGVPYAWAERLHPPGPPQPWQGTKLADAFGPVCPQKYPDISNRTASLTKMPRGRYLQLKKMLPMLVNQSEDCLYMNIYVPGSGNRGFEAPYAVLVWIHGESYEWGSGNPYDGSVLASHGHVIVLTLNFRLGLLGFLKTRSGPRPSLTGGNLAVKDILAALRWARTNLQSFGGDTTRLILMGDGTGAALANLVLISPEAKGLVHRLILLSGSVLSPWAMVHDPDALRSTVAEQLGCNIELESRTTPSSSTNSDSDDDDDITECLVTKPIEALLDVRLDEARFAPRWGPHVAPGAPEPLRAMEQLAGDAFVTSSLLAGVATTESSADFGAAEIQYGFEEEYRDRVLRTFVRNAYFYHLNEIYAAIRNEYTDWDKPIRHPINIRDATMEALSDGHTAAPLLKVAHMHARRGAPTYFYHFAYQSKESDYPQRLGSVRGEQVAYAFGAPLVAGGMAFTATNYTRQDEMVAEALLALVVAFAKVGDPNGRPGDPGAVPPQYADYGRGEGERLFEGVEWAPYEPGAQRYMAFGLKPKMKSHYRGHKMALWLNLVPQLHRPGTADVSMRHHHFRERDPSFYAGPVRPESSFTLLYGRSAAGGGGAPGSGAAADSEATSGGVATPTECQPTGSGVLGGAEDAGGSSPASSAGIDRQAELVRRLAADRHYYSYTMALGVTVGVGCLLLLLNVMIFAGMYYHRTRSKRRAEMQELANASSSSQSSVQLGSSGLEIAQLPIQYNVVDRSPIFTQKSFEKQVSFSNEATLKPPKKRVQIQEISV